MISFEKKVLPNGLAVIIAPIKGSNVTTVNVLYDVGSKDEKEESTGFAHFFEHLMFSGTPNEEHFDWPLQMAGASNNAFTSTDLTNYYIQIPHSNIETALYMEADRMKMLSFSEKAFEVQKQVVAEEFKQRYLNQPYGDLWLHMRPLLFDKVPYRWPTIGKELSHIEDFTMENVKAFYHKWYNPNNATLVIAGAIEAEEGFSLAEKYFGEIENLSDKPNRTWPNEPLKKESVEKVLKREVPSPAIYISWPIPARAEREAYALDFLSDLLSSGRSSRLKQEVLLNQEIFTDLSAHVSGEIHQGIFTIGGKLHANQSIEEGKKAIFNCLENLVNNGISDEELKRNKKQFLTSFHHMNTSTWNKAFLLAFGNMIGDENMINELPAIYESITAEELVNVARKYLLEQAHASIAYEPQLESAS